MAFTTYNNQDASANTLVQGLHSHNGNINVSVNDNPGKRLDLLDWLSPISIEKHHEDSKSHLIIAKDSGSWFLKSDRYLDWMDPTKSDRMLWCPGLPGAGKTVMASLIIDQLTTDAASFRQTHENSVCWLYLGSTDAKGRPGALLAALLRYMVRKSEKIPHYVESLYQNHLEVKTSPTDDSVMKCLIEICRGKENIFLVVDAMDEYPEPQRNVLIDYIHDMLQQLPALRVLITSRLLQSIADELHSPSRYDIEAHDDDLSAFIRTQLSLHKNKHLRGFVMSVNGTDIPLVEKIVNTVVRRSDGMFLLAKLQLDYVASKRIEADCLAALDEPPMDRDKLYAKTMDRIMAQPEEIRDWAARILTWVCYAARALTIDELQVAIQRKPFSSRTLDSSFKLNVEDIMEFCGGLISINKHTNSVVFFHYTVQEYFNHNLERHFPVAHDMIVSRCAIRLTGLLRDYQELIKDYRMGIVVGGDVLRQLLKDYELIEYSVKYLGHHVRQAEKPLTSALESVHKPNSACLQPSSPRANTSLSRETHQQLYNLMSDAVTREPLLKLLSYDGQYSRGSRRFDTSKNPTAIHIAASLGIYAATVSLIDANPRCAINDKDFNDETAVMIAMRKNYSHLVTLFVQRGAEVDLRTSTGREVLLYAAGRGLTTIADDIIAQVQEPASDRKRRRRLGSNTRPADDSVSLLCAAYHGDGTTITRLLKNSTLFKIAMEDGVLGVCLLLAAQKRKHDIVRILLAEGVDINSRDAAGRTALHRAAVWNDKDLVELLLGYNADVDIKDDKLDTAWSSINLSDSHAEVEAILVKAKADVNTKGEYGVSGLYIAAADGATHRVRRLLKNGTDPNIATRYGWCPLHWAASNGHYECTRHLLEYGAHPSPMSDTSVTPLDMAVGNKNHRIIALLSEYQAKRARELIGQRAISDSPSPQSAVYRENVEQETDDDQERELGDTIATSLLHENLEPQVVTQPEQPVDCSRPA